MSLPGYDDWLQNGDYAQDAYGENYDNVTEEDMPSNNLYTPKTTAELEPGDMLELLGDEVFDDEYLDAPDLSPWIYEYGVVATVEPYDGPVPGISLITLTNGEQSYVKNNRKWKVVE